VRRVRSSRALLLILIAFAVVIGTDQAAKWLAWRHLDGALINEGGFIALRPGVRAWFADPTMGAVADGIGAALVATGLAWLLRRPRPLTALTGAALVAAGWTSNLLDRFGLHTWTAPGSLRGVVDFIPSGGASKSNLADCWITLGMIMLVGAAVVAAFRRPDDGAGEERAGKEGGGTEGAARASLASGGVTRPEPGQ
jgi:lipoprotein signal peptidase